MAEPAAEKGRNQALTQLKFMLERMERDDRDKMENAELYEGKDTYTYKLRRARYMETALFCKQFIQLLEARERAMKPQPDGGQAKEMSRKDIPENWRDRCSGSGHERYVDKNGVHRYCDTDEPVAELYRPCAKCGKYPTDAGDDHCLGHLGNVLNACCGHGTQKGYIQFDNGVTIRGFFEIEHAETVEREDIHEPEAN